MDHHQLNGTNHINCELEQFRFSRMVIFTYSISLRLPLDWCGGVHVKDAGILSNC